MFIISVKLFPVNEKSLRTSGFLLTPAGSITIRYSVYNRRQKSRLSQPIPLFSFPHMEAPAPSDTATMV